MADIYRNFRELSEKETEDVDYKIELADKGTDFVVIGIHGAEIEPGTEDVVRNIAGNDLSYYLFLGNSEHQHITSVHFDEPRCVDLIAKSKKVISIHGEHGPGEFVMLGGLDDNLIAQTTEVLAAAGFEIDPSAGNVRGEKPNNICNKGSSGKGLQIEMSRGLRDSLEQDPARMNVFTQVIRSLAQ